MKNRGAMLLANRLARRRVVLPKGLAGVEEHADAPFERRHSALGGYICQDVL